MGAEQAAQGVLYTIPVATMAPERQWNPGEIQVIEYLATPEYPHGVIEVRDPVLGLYRIGDQTLIEDKATDHIMMESWRHYTYMMDSRQMGHTEEFEIMPGGGRMARMPHMLQCAAITARLGGSPRDILAMEKHDDPHRQKGHQDDSLLREVGGEAAERTAHDYDQVEFWYRSGFVARLQAKGLCDEDGLLANGVHITELAIDDRKATSPMNRPAPDLDYDRLGYGIMQEATMPGGIERARAQLAAVAIQSNHLVFTSVEQAADFVLRQADRWYRYWASRENLALGELSKMLTRHVLTTDHPLAAQYQTHFPGDNLRGLESEWQRTVYQIAEKDAGVRGLLKIMKAIADTARHHNETPRDVSQPYGGPKFPLWAVMADNPGKLLDTLPSSKRGLLTQSLVIRSNPGKVRRVDPHVSQDGNLVRLSELRPDVVAAIEESSQWVRQGFTLTIDLMSQGLGLTDEEARGVRAMTSTPARKRWKKALERPEMSQAELTLHLGAMNRRYRSIGAASTAHLVEATA